MDKEIYMRSVEHAAELAGGYDELATRISASPEEVINWSLGSSKPDSAAFLRVLDVILVETRNIWKATMASEVAQSALAKVKESSEQSQSFIRKLSR